MSKKTAACGLQRLFEYPFRNLNAGFMKMKPAFNIKGGYVLAIS